MYLEFNVDEIEGNMLRAVTPVWNSVAWCRCSTNQIYINLNFSDITMDTLQFLLTLFTEFPHKMIPLLYGPNEYYETFDAHYFGIGIIKESDKEEFEQCYKNACIKVIEGFKSGCFKSKDVQINEWVIKMTELAEREGMLCI